jgi:hypothetical protein
MKTVFNLLLVLIGTFSAYSQTQSVAFTAVGKGVATPFLTDYHCLGINVSGLGWGTGFENKKFTIGSSEFGFGMYSDSLNSERLRNLSRSIVNKATGKSSSFNFGQQADAAAMYAQAGVSIFADFNWGGFAFQGKKFGGIAFNVRENYQWYSRLNDQTTDILFRGKLSSYFDSLTISINGDTSRIANNSSLSQDTLAAVIQGSISVPLHLSELTNGSQIKMVWNRSYNVGYGRKILGKDSVFVLYGGIGGRIISSMAMFDLQSDASGLAMYSSISPAFKINYGSISGANLLHYSGGIPPAVGNGYGVDLAASVIFFGKLKLAAAINNIGAVTYTRNVYKVQDTLFGSFSLSGLSDANITNTLNQLMRDGGVLHLVGQDKYVLQNASDFRLGGSFETKRLKLGFDMVAPFNKENPGSIQNAVFSFGGEIRPMKWLVLNAGYFGGGIYKNNIPLGITFILKDGGYECGIASRDALSFFSKDAHSISTAFGFARFRF